MEFVMADDGKHDELENTGAGIYPDDDLCPGDGESFRDIALPPCGVNKYDPLNELVIDNPSGPRADPKAPIPKEERGEIAAALGLVTQLGVSMFACLFVGVLVGRTLDGWIGTSPLFLIIFMLLGAFASFKVLYDLIIKKWMK